MNHPPRQVKILRTLALILILGFGFGATQFSPFDEWLSQDSLVQVMESIRSSPDAWAVFVFLFAAMSCAALPVTPLMLAAGGLFGFGLGSLYNWFGSCVAAWAAYGVARWLGADTLESLFERPIARFRRAGFRTTLLLRLIPIFPFAGVNFGAGAARVPFREYVLATALGMIPSSISFTLFAAATRAVWTEPDPANWALFTLSIALLVLGAFLPLHYRRRLRGDTPPDPPELS